MSNGEFNRKTSLFDAIGVDLNAPIDRTKEGYAVYLENFRPEIDQTLSPRPGTGNGVTVVAGQSPVHSIRRLNDSTSGTTVSRIIVGTGTHIGSVNSALGAPTDIDSGFSGDPLSMAIHQPTESVKPYCYVCDRSKMLKIDSANNKKQVGLPRPTALPTAALAAPSYKIIDEMDSIAAWAAGGGASGLIATSRVDPAFRSITAILYDTGTTGWACVRPSSMTDIGKGMRLSVVGANPETVTVQDVWQGSAETTVARGKYETGTQFGWFHLTTPVDQIDVDCMVLMDRTGTPEYVRVLAVERTKDGYTSFRAKTVGTFLSGETAQVVPSFRAYFPLTHVATDPLSATSIKFIVAAAGTGYITRNIGAAAALDLSTIASGVPTKPDDLVHLSLYVDKPELITEIKYYLDIDADTTNVAGAADFTENYYFHTMRQNDFVPVTKDTQTDIANAAVRYQRQSIEKTKQPAAEPGVPTVTEDPREQRLPDSGLPAPHPDYRPDEGKRTESNQTASGQNQYAEIIFRVGELLLPDLGRVGSDYSRGLTNVAAIKIAVIAKGAVSIRVDGLWIGGGYGPDASGTRPRQYRFRYRDSSTGACSNWSPAMRGGVSPYRQKVNVGVTGIDLTANPEADKIDVAAYGGNLLGWNFAGSINNPGATTATFEDTYSEEDLTYRKDITDGNIHYQLWPVISTPIGGLGTSAGTVMSILAGSIDVNTAPGTAIKVDGLDFTLYRVFSASAFETVESMGYRTAVTWDIPAPLIENQRLPIFVGPFHNFYFGMGDKLNPWRLYYTNGNDPDTTQDTHWINIESEILQNGLIDGDRFYVWSTEKCFVIEPAFTLAETGAGLFVHREITDSIGLPFRYAMCKSALLSKDGIYEVPAGPNSRISDDLRKIFVHEGSAGVTANGFAAVDMSAANVNNLRLSRVQGELFFDYVDVAGARWTFVRRQSGGGLKSGWRPYKYAAGAEAQVHYEEEGDKVTSVLMGGVNGKIYRLGRSLADEGGASITARVVPRCEDFGDPIISKYVGDVLLDYDTDGATINVTPGLDNNSSTPDGPFALAEVAGRRQRRLDLNNGQGRRGRNVTILVSTTVTTQRPILYLWQASWQPRAETTLLRADDYSLVGGGGAKFARGLWIYADTYNVVRSAVLEYTKDDGTIASLVFAAIQHATLTEIYYPIPSGIYLTASRLRATDSNTWDFQGYRLDADPAPPLSNQAGPWIDFGEARYVNGVRFEIDTVNVPVSMGVRVDENVLQTTISALANSGPVLANGRAIKAYSFDIPFITHIIRPEPSVACRIWKTEWITEPEPELAYMWWAQQTDCGIAGYKVFGDGYITVRSTEAFILEFEVDGVTKASVFYDTSNNSVGERRQYRFRWPAMKGKIIRPRVYCLTSAGRVSVFHKEFRQDVKRWGSEGSWESINLLGAGHYQSGAEI